MSSKKPRDLNSVLSAFGAAAAVQRNQFNLGAFTANTTVVPAPRMLFDRRTVIREIWFSASAVPVDTDGLFTINAIVNDISEAADDTIITSLDGETVFVAADKAYKATFDAETSENQLTVEAGDTLRFTLVNDSAGIGTNATISALVVTQALKSL